MIAAEVAWTGWQIIVAIVASIATLGTMVAICIYVGSCAARHDWPWERRATRKAKERQAEREHKERMAAQMSGWLKDQPEP